MLKGKLYYKNKKIKYKVVMVREENDLTVIIKTRLGKISLFPLELILESFNGSETLNNSNNSNNKDTNCNKDFSVRIKDFLVKWNCMSKSDMIFIVEEFIKNEIDKDSKDYHIDYGIDKFIKDFNSRNYYERNIPDAPRKIPMPECKNKYVHKTTNIIDKYNNIKENKFTECNGMVSGNFTAQNNTMYNFKNSNGKIIKQIKVENWITYERDNINEEWRLVN